MSWFPLLFSIFLEQCLPHLKLLPLPSSPPPPHLQWNEQVESLLMLLFWPKIFFCGDRFNQHFQWDFVSDCLLQVQSNLSLHSVLHHLHVRCLATAKSWSHSALICKWGKWMEQCVSQSCKHHDRATKQKHNHNGCEQQRMLTMKPAELIFYYCSILVNLQCWGTGAFLTTISNY